MIAYIITNNGAKILHENSFPIVEAIDMLPVKLAEKGVLKRLAVFPSPFFVRAARSDTALIT